MQEEDEEDEEEEEEEREMFKIAFFLNGDTAINCQLQLVPLVGATAIPDIKKKERKKRKKNNNKKKESNAHTAEQFRQLNCIQGMLFFMDKSKFMFTSTFFQKWLYYLFNWRLCGIRQRIDTFA